MDIFYTNETLYVNILDLADDFDFEKMKRRVFKILEDYGIYNVELKFINCNNPNQELINLFIKESERKYRACVKFR